MQKYFYISHSHYKLEKTFQMRAVLERRGLGAGSVTHAYVTKPKRKPDDEIVQVFVKRFKCEQF